MVGVRPVRVSMMLAAALLPSVVAGPALAAPPGEMSVAEFLPRAERLMAKGMGAVFSSDLKPVVNEMKAIGPAYRADLAVARAAGRTDLGCPPPKGDKRMRLGADKILGYMRAVPPERRATTTVKAVFYDMMRKNFPC